MFLDSYDSEDYLFFLCLRFQGFEKREEGKHMYSMNIYALIGVLFVTLLCFVAFMYYTKRKYDSIDRYYNLNTNKSNSYRDKKGEYEKNLEDLGVKSHNIKKLILNVVQLFRGSL